MIWVLLAAVALVVMAPVLWFALRGGRLRGRREAALALHRAQLAELDRDLAAGRLLAEEHAGAVLEVQRRLLADAALREPEAARSGAGAALLVSAGVPLAALALYLVTAGHPGPPPPPPPAPAAEAPANAPDPVDEAKADELIGQLRNRLALMDPHAPRTLEGYEILGNAELRRGRLPEAAAAFKRVLDDRFDPTLAAETAEILTEASGKITPEAAGLFRKALARAPADAPWRKMVEKRVTEANGS